MADTPTIIVRIAFTTNPGDTPSWTDISAYVRSFEMHRGRQHELGKIEAGTATLMLDNLDRRFDPLHIGGPYYGNLLPMRRIEIKAVWNATTYYLFHGYVEGWPPSYPYKKDAIVELGAVDAFKVLNLDKLTESYSQERSDVRVGNVLDDIGWPAGDRVLSTGQSNVQAKSLSKESGLSHLDEVIESENGLLFMDGRGRVVFRDRHYRIKNHGVSQATFGDSGSELRYSDIKLSYDDSWIWNEIQVTRIGGSTQTASDSASQAKYYSRILEYTNLLFTTDAEALLAAQWLLAQYKEPSMRVDSITIQPRRDPTNLWPQVLGRDIGDRITVKRRPPGGGSAISFDCHIEAISHIVTPKTWATTWQLSPADTQAYWVLEDAVLGKLNSTTRLAY